MATTPLEAYRLYVSIKNHFNKPDFHYVPNVSGGRISPQALEKRNDRNLFRKLAKMGDPLHTLVAFFCYNEKAHISAITEEERSEAITAEFKRRQQALVYTLAEDLKRVPNLYSALYPASGERPGIMHHLATGNVHMVTLTALDAALGLGEEWQKACPDPVSLPKLILKMKKLRPFLNLTDATLEQIRETAQKNWASEDAHAIR